MSAGRGAALRWETREDKAQRHRYVGREGEGQQGGACETQLNAGRGAPAAKTWRR